MPRARVLAASVLCGATVMAIPRGAAAQLPPPDVTVANARSNGGLSLTVFTASSLGSGFTPSVLIGVEVHGLAETVPPQPSVPRQLELTYLAESGGATLAPHVVAVPLTDDAAVRRAVEQDARVLTRISLPAGRYALRVTARDSGDRRTATVVRDLEVPDLLATSITMSDLVMSASGVRGVTHTQPDEDWLLPLVARPPTGRRAFSRSEQVEVDVEIYEAPPDDGFGNQLSIVTSLLAADGRVVREAMDSGTSETLPSGVFGYQHYSLVPVAAVPPGLYILRVSVKVDGIVSVSRSVPITITDR